MMKQQYPPLPSGFRPEILRRLTMKEFLIVVARYGIEAIGERMQFDEAFMSFVRKITAPQ
jgi:hypothetical protein